MELYYGSLFGWNYTMEEWSLNLPNSKGSLTKKIALMQNADDAQGLGNSIQIIYWTIVHNVSTYIH